jgi:hypothetical protein
MKKLLFTLFIIAGFTNYAQTRISGKVIDSDNIPLIGAAVYLNNTSIGTTTDYLGEFELYIKAGVHDLIVSYLGYETIKYQIDTHNPVKKITFKTKEMGNVLDEIILQNKKYTAEDRASFLSKFIKSFIGETIFSKRSKIQNLEVIKFHYDSLHNILEAYASKPIKIINKDLGYEIYYDLIEYELSSKKITYLGYSRYEEIGGSRSKQRKWQKNRQRAYNGSLMHFIRAARNGTLYKEGFVINQSKRVLNTKRPSDSVLEKTRKYFHKFIQNKKMIKPQQFKNSTDINTLNLETNSLLTKNKKDSIMGILKKARLKKYVDIKIKDCLTEKDFLTYNRNLVTLKFKHHLDILFMNEKEEYNFRKGPNRLNYQNSKIILFAENVLLDPSGIFIEPLDVFTEGYWGYEKIADALPLDYIPEK